MQNFFLDPAAGRPLNPLAVAAEKKLLDVGIPACREAGIQVVHLTWGIEDQELETLPPALLRGFGAVLEGDLEDVDGERVVEGFGEKPTVGEELGDVKLEDGEVVAGGRLLMRDQWNTALHPPLQSSFASSQTLPLPDVRFHKSHISGFSSPELPIVKFLRDKGIKTLLFGGVNTDQCVLGSLQDAAMMGFDCVLVRDAAATGSPEYARKMAEYNCRKSWGFVVDCDALSEGVRDMR
jgi:nicotinamidase-related amidase